MSARKAVNPVISTSSSTAFAALGRIESVRYHTLKVAHPKMRNAAAPPFTTARSDVWRTGWFFGFPAMTSVSFLLSRQKAMPSKASATIVSSSRNAMRPV